MPSAEEKKKTDVKGKRERESERVNDILSSAAEEAVL